MVRSENIATIDMLLHFLHHSHKALVREVRFFSVLALEAIFREVFVFDEVFYLLDTIYFRAILKFVAGDVQLVFKVIDSDNIAVHIILHYRYFFRIIIYCF